MTRAEVIQYVNAQLTCQLATVDEGRPRVRTLVAYRADEQGILFHTGAFKDLHKQLQKDPRVELCFCAPQGLRQLRVAGRAQLLQDEALKDEILQARPFLKLLGDRAGLMVYRVVDMETSEWSMNANQEPTRFIKF